ncbi:MAG: hypothetical protein MJ126_05755 [Lachnospiraceae bacterium]|nr:hypothetical protein [Lachnospiraceae bacterium]
MNNTLYKARHNNIDSIEMRYKKPRKNASDKNNHCELIFTTVYYKSGKTVEYFKNEFDTKCPHYIQLWLALNVKSERVISDNNRYITLEYTPI